jgi:thiol:disulfide interchange protein
MCVRIFFSFVFFFIAIFFAQCNIVCCTAQLLYGGWLAIYIVESFLAHRALVYKVVRIGNLSVGVLVYLICIFIARCLLQLPGDKKKETRSNEELQIYRIYSAQVYVLESSNDMAWAN